MSGVTQAGSAASEADGSGKASLDGTSERRPEGNSQEGPIHHVGSPFGMAIRLGESIGTDNPEESVLLTGETGFSQEEALQCSRSELLVGPGKKC